MSKYSNMILTDNNMDIEVEKLQSIYSHLDYFEYETFVKCLPVGFQEETTETYSEWVVEDWCTSFGTQYGKLAFEFRNGFLVFNFGVCI